MSTTAMPVPAVEQLHWEIRGKKSPRTSDIFTREKELIPGNFQTHAEDNLHRSLSSESYSSRSRFSVSGIDSSDDDGYKDGTEASELI